MYSFVPFRVTDSEELRLSQMLMELAWGTCDYATADFIRWQYVANPDGHALGVLARPEGAAGELACQYVTIPSRLWCPLRKARVASLLSVNTATHPNHRKRGLFVQAANQTFAQARFSGFDSVYGFPNDASRPGFLKLGFSAVEPLQLFISISRPAAAVARAALILKTRLFPPLKQGPVCGILEAHAFAAACSTIGLSGSQLVKDYMHVPRDVAWLTWRYLEHPFWRYSFCVTDRAIFVSRFMMLGDITVAILVDILGAPTKNCVKLLSEFFINERPALVCGVFSPSLRELHPEVRHMFQIAVPLRLSPKNFHVIYLPLQDGSRHPAKTFFCLGDFDLY